MTANDSGRYTLFTVGLTQLRCPPGTRIEWSITSDRVLGRNQCVRQALRHDSEWLLFLDDDHTIPHDLLERLLARDVPVVGSIYLQRHQPFMPVAYTSYQEETGYTPIDLQAYNGEEMVEVEGLGTGGMLIRREVMEAIPEPWFEHYSTASEDLLFCRRARELGFPVYVDLAARIGHMSPSSLTPFYQDGQWWIGFDVADGVRLPVSYDSATNAKIAIDEEVMA